MDRPGSVHVRSPWRMVLPVPDASIGVGDRELVAYMYPHGATTTVTFKAAWVSAANVVMATPRIA